MCNAILHERGSKTGLFEQVWRHIAGEGNWVKHEWVVNEDADAVFFPYRFLRKLVAQKVTAGEDYLLEVPLQMQFTKGDGPLRGRSRMPKACSGRATTLIARVHGNVGMLTAGKTALAAASATNDRH